MGDLRYCFERKYVERTLGLTKSKGLAVVDLEGISQEIVNKALARGVLIYGYVNIGALESGRSYYSQFKEIRLARYYGWTGEYWIDPTDKAWQDHIIDLCKWYKGRGAIGIYLDNTDIYYMCKEGFAEEDAEMMRQAPTSGAVFKALRETVEKIVNETGLVVMPNGGDMFVDRMDREGFGHLIKTVNQEGVSYTDQKATSKDDKKYYTKYLDRMKKKGRYIRIIEYPKNKAQAAKAKAYAKIHGWKGIYISYHKDLRGD